MSDSGRIHILNEIGTRVWVLIDGKRSVEEIVAAVRTQLEQEGYESVPQDIAGDVEQFLEEIGAMSMITMGSET
jgi:hypothetical protein